MKCSLSAGSLTFSSDVIFMLSELRYCQTPVQVLGLGVDFVLPLSQEEQQEEQQEQQEQPHQNIPEGNIL